MPKKTKFYAVARGRECGIFLSWPECQQQVTGYRAPIFKSFKSREEAEAFLREKQGAPTGKKRPAEEQSVAERELVTSSVSLPTDRADSKSTGQLKSDEDDVLVVSSSKRTKLTGTALSTNESHGAMAQSSVSTKCFAVAVGRRPGIYNTWQETQSQTAGFSGAVYRSFPSEEKAKDFLDQRGIDWHSGNRKEIMAPWHIPPVNAKPTASVEIPSDEQGDIGMSAGLHITMNFDGGARGNPGLAGAGAVVVSKYVEGSDVAPSSAASTVLSSRGDGSIVTICKIREFCGYRTTNNVAEYTGLRAGLRRIKDIVQEYLEGGGVRKSNSISFKSPKEQNRKGEGEEGTAATGNNGHAKVIIVIRGDSNLIIEQINGTNEVRSTNLKAMYEQCKSLIQTIRTLGSNVKIATSHVFRECNVVADGLANEAMDTKRSWISTEKGQ